MPARLSTASSSASSGGRPSMLKQRLGSLIGQDAINLPHGDTFFWSIHLTPEQPEITWPKNASGLNKTASKSMEKSTKDADDDDYEDDESLDDDSDYATHTLSVQNVIIDPIAPSDAEAVVYTEVSDDNVLGDSETRVPLAILRRKHVDQTAMNYEYKGCVTFRLEGDAGVYITGYDYVEYKDFDGLFDDEDEAEDEDDEEIKEVEAANASSDAVEDEEQEADDEESENEAHGKGVEAMDDEVDDVDDSEPPSEESSEEEEKKPVKPKAKRKAESTGSAKLAPAKRVKTEKAAVPEKISVIAKKPKKKDEPAPKQKPDLEIKASNGSRAVKVAKKKNKK